MHLDNTCSNMEVDDHTHHDEIHAGNHKLILDKNVRQRHHRLGVQHHQKFVKFDKFLKREQSKRRPNTITLLEHCFTLGLSWLAPGLYMSSNQGSQPSSNTEMTDRFNVKHPQKLQLSVQ